MARNIAVTAGWPSISKTRCLSGGMDKEGKAMADVAVMVVFLAVVVVAGVVLVVALLRDRW